MKYFISLLILLSLSMGCSVHKYYYPRMVTVKPSTTKQGCSEVCRFDPSGTMICEFNLDFLGDSKDQELYCFPKSEFERE
jgi:hypothetical protein